MEQICLCWMLFLNTLLIRASTSTESINYVRIGDTAVLRCPYEEIESWLTIDDEKETYVIGEEINPLISIARRLALTSRQDLIIKNIEETDFKVYSCISGGNEQHYVTLRRRDDPTNMTILEESEPNIVHGLEDQQMSLTCTVSSGTPEENLTWIRDETLLAVGGPGLLIYNFTPERADHLSNFTCSALTDEDGFMLNLTVQIKLILIPNVTVTASPTSTVKEGELCQLACLSEMPYAIQNYSWEHNGSQLRNYTSTISLVNTSRAQDGQYTCFASNRAGTGEASIHINVLYPPAVSNSTMAFTVKEKARLIHCNVDGKPGVFQFGNWTHLSSLDDQFIRTLKGFDNGSLLLPRDVTKTLQFEDIGLYVCNVSNGQADKYGNFWQTGVVKVLVEGPPLFVKPLVKWQHGHINTTTVITVDILSSSGKLESKWSTDSLAEVSGNRFDNSCMKNFTKKAIFGKQIYVKVNRCILTIANTQRQDFGKYHIKVSNGFGDRRETITLVTPGPPHTPSILSLQSGPTTVRVYWTSKLYLGCIEKLVVNYRKTTHKEWKKKYVGFDNVAGQHSFIIDELQPSTDYTIRMFATNDEGNSSLTDEMHFTTRGHNNKWSNSKRSGVLTATVIMFCLCVVILGIWWWKHRNTAKKKPVSNYSFEVKQAEFEVNPPEQEVQQPEHVDEEQNEMYVNVINPPPPMNPAHMSGACGVSADVYSSIDRRKRISTGQIVTYKIAHTM